MSTVAEQLERWGTEAEVVDPGGTEPLPFYDLILEPDEMSRGDEDERAGEKAGHKFHGNQWDGSAGYVPARMTRDEVLAHPDVTRYNEGTPVEEQVPDGMAHHDVALETIARLQGFDAPPTVVKEFSSNTKGGTLYRGLPQRRYLDDFRRGDYFAGTGVVGSGTYTTTARQQAKEYAHTGGVMAMKLKADARTIDRKGVEDLWRQEMAAAKPGERRVLEDPGRVAAIHGYDAITVQRSGVGNYVVVLNRTAVEVLAKNVP